ncbi:MAG: DUF1587 domain-containing protein [Myxococcota bacterium]
MRTAHTVTALAVVAGAGCDGTVSAARPSNFALASAPAPGSAETKSVRSPLRRLTRLELNNAYADLFDDRRAPANALPSEELGNGFGNDADALSVSPLLTEKLLVVAEDVAAHAIQNLGVLRPYAECVDTFFEPNDRDACAQSVIQGLLPQVFRRAVNVCNFADNATFDPIPPRLDPLLIFRQLFPDDGSSEATIARRVASRKSILDFVGGRYRTLSSRLGARDLNLSRVPGIPAVRPIMRSPSMPASRSL